MPCVKSGARAGSLYRNLVAHALTLGASGDRAPVRQQPCSHHSESKMLDYTRITVNNIKCLYLPDRFIILDPIDRD